MGWSFFDKGEGSERKSKRGDTKRRKSRHRRPLFEELEQRRVLAVLTVNAPNAASDLTASDANLTLREALTIVNSGSVVGFTQEAAQIDLSSPLGVNDTIKFASGVTSVTLAGATELPISDSVTITGGKLVTVDGQNASRIFDITAGDVTFDGLTLTRGKVTGANNGGAILSTSINTLNLVNSTITTSSAANGGGVFVVGDLFLNGSQIGGTGTNINQATGYGGGLAANGATTILNSTITGNTAGGDGGGLFSSGDVDVQSSTIVNNTANGLGGGIRSSTGSVSVMSSSVSGNNAKLNGGGISVSNTQTVVVQNSSVSGNTAGALASVQGGAGGGINAHRVTVRNSTIAKNQANSGTVNTGNGGGIAAAIVSLQNATVADNHADVTDGNGGGILADTQLTILNSIVVGNSDAGTHPDISEQATTTVKFSLIGDIGTRPAGAVGSQFEVLGTTQQTSSFQNFIGRTGSPAGTIAMSAVLETVLGSPDVAVLTNNNGAAAPTTNTIKLIGVAIDKGSNSLVSNAGQGDQRGLPFARIVPTGGRVDMGAFEVQSAAPEIDVQVNSASIASGGTANVGTLSGTILIPVTIRNTGTAPLTITSANISGGDSGDFVIQAPGPTTPIAAGGSTTFNVAFTPTANTLRTTNLIIQNNDSDESTYTITLQGTGSGVVTTTSEINVLIDGVSVASGAPATDFGTTAGAVNKTVTIQNLGTGTLNLTGIPLLVSSNSNEFVVQQPSVSSIAPGGSASFIVSFMPHTNAALTAVLTIPNNDTTGGENPYILNLSGTGAGIALPAPEINVQVDSADILSGQTESVGSTGTSITKTFTIQNVGNAALNLTGTPLVAVSGANASDFHVTVQPAASVTGGTSTTFTLIFAPTANGLRTATLTIANNDATGGENPYIVNLQGVGSGFSTGVLFSENFDDGTVDPGLVPQSGSFNLAGTTYAGTRTSPGTNAIVTIPSLTLPNHYKVDATVNMSGGNGSSLWNNGLIIFDYVDPSNFKFAGAFEIIDQYIIGQVVNGKTTYLTQVSRQISASTNVNLSLDINGSVATLSANGTQVASRLFSSPFTGKVGYGTLNANTTFDNLVVTQLT